MIRVSLRDPPWEPSRDGITSERPRGARVKERAMTVQAD
jgi:hypothetical protein